MNVHVSTAIRLLVAFLGSLILLPSPASAQLPAEDHLRISLSAPNTYALSVTTDSLWEYQMEASDDLEIWQPLDSIFLPGDGGVHSQRVIVPQGAVKAFFRYSMRQRAGGVSGDTLTDWDRIYSFNADTFLDTDHDGVPDILETALGTNAYDGFSQPWEVTRVDPFDGQAGHPRDGAIVVYLNQPLPASVVNMPANFVRRLYHTVEDILDFANVAPGSAMILPGRKAVAFLPSPALGAGSNHTYVNNYKIDFTTSVTGIAKLVPWHSEFSTVDTFDDVGTWVKMVRPGETAIEVATDLALVIDWSQPLHPTTLTSGNVTVIEQVSGTPVTVTVTFDYDTNRMTLQHATPFQPDTAYTVTLGTGFHNLMGKPLLNAFTWSFRTRPVRPAPVAGQGPYVTAIAPGDFSTSVDVSNTSQITLTFSETMNDSTLDATTVHLRKHGATADVSGLFSYDAPSKTLSFAFDFQLDFAARYELTLDSSAILSSASSALPLQGQTEFVFTIAPDPFQSGSGAGMGGAGSGPGGSSGTPDPEQPPPLVLQLSYGDPDMDAGASVKLSITLRDSSQREQQMPNATNDYLTRTSPEIPAGSTVIVTPQFLKGNDPDYEEELSEVQVEVNGGTVPEGSNYLVFKQSTTATAAPAIGDAVWNFLGLLADGAYTAQVATGEKLAVGQVEMKLRTTGRIEPAPENSAYEWCKAGAGGTDLLGALPMGDGRGEAPGAAYTSPVQVTAKIPVASNLTWRWKRTFYTRSWFIRNVGGTWKVALRSKLGSPNDLQPDGPSIDACDNTPSQTTGLIYTYDNSAVGPAIPAPGQPTLQVGEYVWQEKQFTYQVECNDGANWRKAGTLDVGQRIIAKRFQVTGNTGSEAKDFQGVENINAIRVLDMQITVEKVRAIVGGTAPIEIDPSANN